MADLSKKQLSERAFVLASQLGTTVKTDGLNHQELTALVADLDLKRKDLPVTLDGTETLPEGYVRPSVEEFVSKGYQAEGYEEFFANHERGLLEQAARAKRDAASSPKGSVSAPAAAGAKGTEAPARSYILAQNKALTTGRGILGEGEEVFARDLGIGGAERLEELYEQGHFVKP